MNEPYVSVGVLSGKSIKFTLKGIYSTDDVAIVTGEQEATLSDSGIAIVWNGKNYTSIEFTPTSYDGDSFELEDVVIGVDFHWQRKERQQFRGSIRLIVSDGNLTAVNIVKVEDYLISVISSEMSSTSSLPLLRAHAVISRSWLLAQMRHRSTPRVDSFRRSDTEITRWWDHDDHNDFDVCADDHCQRYQGISRVKGSAAHGAVDDTCGMVLMFNGELCDARFSKCCGGVFEEFISCWEDILLPYLVAGRDTVNPVKYPDLTEENEAREWILSCPASFCSNNDEHILSQVLNNYDRERNDFYRWTEEITQEKIIRLLNERSGINVGEVIDLIPLQRGTSGRIIRLRIIGTEGEIVIGKELMIRRTLSESHLLSSAFVVDRHFKDGGNVPDSFILNGAGWGHGVGLCQIGAAVMGEKGYTFDEILRHYYPGASIVKLY